MSVDYRCYNSKEVAKKMGVHHSTICLWCRKGKIPFTDIGKGKERPIYQFNESDIEKIKIYKENHYFGNGHLKIDTSVKVIVPEDAKYIELLEENRQLRLEVEALRKEKEAFMSSILELMAKFE